MFGCINLLLFALSSSCHKGEMQTPGRLASFLEVREIIKHLEIGTPESARWRIEISRSFPFQKL